MKASEILAKALEIWGPKGEHWLKGDLEYTSREGNSMFCLYGGMGMAAINRACYNYEARDLLDAESEFPLTDEQQETLHNYDIAVHKVSQVINSRYNNEYQGDIVSFNDANERTFSEVKGVVCEALKDCLEEESQNANK